MSRGCLLLTGLVLATPILLADRPPAPLGIEVAKGRPQLTLPEAPIAPVVGMDYRLWIESSGDLTHWDAAGEINLGTDGRLVFPTEGTGVRFHRLRAELVETGDSVDGADLFGLNRVFAEELSALGPITPTDFAERFVPDTPHLEQITFDPRDALFWSDFNADPAVVNADKTEGDPGWRSFDFRLTAEELAVFLQNGFVVSERLAEGNPLKLDPWVTPVPTFASVFYKVFNDDLPVFVSADPVLHAWHFTYQHMLSEMEETLLLQHLRAILDTMAATLDSLPPQVREGTLRVSLEDAEYFLAVGRQLLRIHESPAFELPVSCDHPRFIPTLQAIDNLEAYLVPPGFEMFGGHRLVDFSQFRPRSYYTRSLQLQHYFRAMMWVARADLRIFPGRPAGPDAEAQALRELGTAVTLALLLQQSDGDLVESWRQMDSILRLFVGRTDSMNFAHLLPLLEASGITSFDSITSQQQIVDLQAAIANGTLGLQLIPGDVHLTPLGHEQAQMPRAFAFMGQRFIPDGWAMAQVTYDRIHWPEEIWPLTFDFKVLRRMCSSLDVAYSVLGNITTADLIAERMLMPWQDGGFRDGYPYAHNLVALKRTFDRYTPEAWGDTLYTRWLRALRALSEPTIGTEFPEAMRTRAWTRRTLNTQLASYTELKHDTLLYGKQPYAASFLCEYPAGFVEPVPAFWACMAALADAAADGLGQLDTSNNNVLTIYRTHDPRQPALVDPAQRQAARIAACRTFSAHMRTLESLAQKELLQQPFTDADLLFIQGLMNSQAHEYVGPTFDGWYPELFYKDYALLGGTADENGSNKLDPLVADIFTAPPDWIDPVGGVLHEATGNVDLLLISVDNGPDRRVYAGPVLSHYEFVLPGPTLNRLTDEEWNWQLQSEGPPPRPDWTRSYLVTPTAAP